MRRLLFVTMILAVFAACQCGGVLGAGETDSFGKGSSPGEKRTLTVGGVDLTFRWCPPGEFMMGSPGSEVGNDSSEKQHRVRLTQGFWLLESEVTQEMWEAVMGTTIQDRITQEIMRTHREFIGARKPMWFVTWDDSLAFCEKLSSMTRQKIVLPTEAEWEYACRAETAGEYAGTGRLDDMGWYGVNSDHRIHEVKGKKANAWGLYDMHGNVWEWCSDWYAGDYYGESPADDPAGPPNASCRVYRGGSWWRSAVFCRSAYRGSYWSFPGYRTDDLGFRPALVP